MPSEDERRNSNRGNNNPLPRQIARRQPDPYPTKEDRGIIYRDTETGDGGILIGGATTRNRYEDGEYLPGRGPADRDR